MNIITLILITLLAFLGFKVLMRIIAAYLLLKQTGLFSFFQAARAAKKQNYKYQQQSSHETREEMVKCATCQVYMPTKDAIKNHELYFCCKEHKKEYKG